jgi:hypothetical protein
MAREPVLGGLHFEVNTAPMLDVTDCHKRRGNCRVQYFRIFFTKDISAKPGSALQATNLRTESVFPP